MSQCGSNTLTVVIQLFHAKVRRTQRIHLKDIFYLSLIQCLKNYLGTGTASYLEISVLLHLNTLS